MLKRKCISLGLAVILGLCFVLHTEKANAADTNVKVTIPQFKVSLNGNNIENQNREYPLLVYRDITYFPMTWYDSRMLGLEASWSATNGLSIKQGPVTSSYVPYKSDSRNAQTYWAEAPASVVTINGKVIDNSKETYPLISFRDVTYFPLTWRFAHDEFGWDYQWSDASGLSITSNNDQVKDVELSDKATLKDVALHNGSYYYVETIDDVNHVYQAPLHQPTSKKEIHSFYTDDKYYSSRVTFQVRGSSLWLMYHTGRGVTGRDNYVKITQDGKAEKQLHGYLDFLESSYGTIVFGLPGGDMYLTQPGEDWSKGKRIGDFNTTYGNQRGINIPFSAAGISGDSLYVLCSGEPGEQNSLCRINLKTNTTYPTIQSGLKAFKIMDNILYFIRSKDDMLYSSALDGTAETLISERPVSWFDVINGNVFYMSKDQNPGLYQADPINNDKLLLPSNVSSVQVMNNKLVCQMTKDANYGVVLFDGLGNILLSVADPVTRIYKSDSGLLFHGANDSGIKTVR
ncbi:DUF5050 domain-containing protein [Paenibacillus sp. YYML68]|uniref:DUF5050 domain-containing protein n=1 Tax=Paenibacillus sp. YYML68 TaxID=2909250 RepID=UPI002491A96F|nr:DUF5050 domain-containing protein [Paenibacillus sp. YYML68]